MISGNVLLICLIYLICMSLFRACYIHEVFSINYVITYNLLILNFIFYNFIICNCCVSNFTLNNFHNPSQYVNYYYTHKDTITLSIQTPQVIVSLLLASAFTMNETVRPVDYIYFTFYMNLETCQPFKHNACYDFVPISNSING